MRIQILVLGLAASLAVVTPGTAEAQPARPFRLCVVDENVLVARSPVAMRMAERFQQIRNEAQQSFQSDSASLEAEADALARVRASLSAAEARAQDEQIARRRGELRERGEEINRNLAALDAELTRSVVQLAGPTIRATAAERGCSAVVGRSSLLDLGDQSLDVTAAVLERMAAVPLR